MGKRTSKEYAKKKKGSMRFLLEGSFDRRFANGMAFSAGTLFLCTVT